MGADQIIALRAAQNQKWSFYLQGSKRELRHEKGNHFAKNPSTRVKWAVHVLVGFVWMANAFIIYLHMYTKLFDYARVSTCYVSLSLDVMNCIETRVSPWSEHIVSSDAFGWQVHLQFPMLMAGNKETIGLRRKIQSPLPATPPILRRPRKWDESSFNPFAQFMKLGFFFFFFLFGQFTCFCLASWLALTILRVAQSSSDEFICTRLGCSCGSKTQAKTTSIKRITAKASQCFTVWLDGIKCKIPVWLIGENGQENSLR